MHAIMKFCMRRRDRYECYVPHPLPLDGKSRMLCSRAIFHAQPINVHLTKPFGYTFQ